jgi:hypothetical protein
MSTIRTASFYTAPTEPFAPAASAPPTPDVSPEMTRRIDTIGDRLGYVSREPAPARKKRWTPVTEPLDQLSFRCAVSDINRFVELADARNETFRECFAYLVKLAPR